MNKKILYSVLFISLFVLSTVAMVAQPVAGATFVFGVPKEAKGIDLEREVMVYDKDAWGDHKGYSIDDTANAIFGDGETGANDVGAKGKTVVQDWERTDIWYFGDHILEARLGPSTQQAYGLNNRWDYFLFIDSSAVKLGTDALGAIPYFAQLGAINVTDNLQGYANGTLITDLGNALAPVAAGTGDRTAITALWQKTFKGTELEREYWYITKDLKSNPDEDDDLVPYIENPHDVWESYLYFTGFMESLMNKLNAMLPYVITYNTTAHQALYDPGTYDPAVWAFFNSTAATVLTGLGYGAYVGGFSNVGTMVGVILQTLQALIQALVDNYPDKKTYLIGILRAGLPGYTPIDKWWEKILDDFDIDEDTIWRTAVYDYHQGGVYLDGQTVVIEFEWYNVLDWHGDKLEEREDYEERYTYGDTGSQSVVEFTDGDDVFYKIESLSPAIPGYEISIFLAAAAISALGLIYVVMKKRRK